MAGIKRLVLDVLKPHYPLTLEYAKGLSELEDVSGVNISLYEVDQQTENIKITIEGDNLNYENIKEVIEDMGGVIHSIDEIAAGRRLVEEVETLQDR
ncbi:MAG TPA: DUF211 domain-containing protein [Candidatus Nanoarchaeia archaeon]|nr:DUF211 domain-containing protein [Candidatus Nanoarchaeia archaeon]